MSIVHHFMLPDTVTAFKKKKKKHGKPVILENQRKTYQVDNISFCE